MENGYIAFCTPFRFSCLSELLSSEWTNRYGIMSKCNWWSYVIVVFFYLWYCIYIKIFAKWSDVNFDSEEVSRFRMVRLNVRFSIIYSQSKYYVSLRLKMHVLNKDIIGKHNSQIKRWKLELIVCCDFYLTYYLWQLQVTMFLVPMIFDRGTVCVCLCLSLKT